MGLIVFIFFSFFMLLCGYLIIGILRDRANAKRKDKEVLNKILKLREDRLKKTIPDWK